MTVFSAVSVLGVDYEIHLAQRHGVFVKILAVPWRFLSGAVLGTALESVRLVDQERWHCVQQPFELHARGSGQWLVRIQAASPIPSSSRRCHCPRISATLLYTLVANHTAQRRKRLQCSPWQKAMAEKNRPKERYVGKF